MIMRSCMVVLCVVVACVAGASKLSAPSHHNSVLAEGRETSARAASPTTHALLSKLGMKKLRVPAAHHRKRLAEQARKRASGDSRMFIIKLPPNPSYYAHSMPALAAARTLPLPLMSNGKPARVYHWNLPVLQKFVGEKTGHHGIQARLDDNEVLNVEHTPTWDIDTSKSRPHPNSIDAPSYYVPTKPKKPSIRKLFPGNGKPKSFYVIDNGKRPPHHHRLLP